MRTNVYVSSSSRVCQVHQSLGCDSHMANRHESSRQLVRRSHADLLVMGSVARTGIPGFFIGNTAEKVLRPLATVRF